MPKIDISIQPLILNIEPSITIYHITIMGGGKKAGIWEESWGSKELLEAFLRGVKAAFSFTEVGGDLSTSRMSAVTLARL